MGQTIRNTIPQIMAEHSPLYLQLADGMPNSGCVYANASETGVLHQLINNALMHVQTAGYHLTQIDDASL